MDPTPCSSPAWLKQRRRDLLADRALTGAGLRAALTELTDGWLRALYAEVAGEAAGVALVAVGGYGRREPAAGSDLDLVLLHDGRRDVDALAERIWYPAWDTGVRLDHSVRTVDEAVAVAAGNLEAALGLLEARHVAGDDALSARLRERVHGRWRATAPARSRELAAAGRERGERAGEVAFLLEPDVKDGRGGLRDVHAWHALAAGWLTDLPPAPVREAYRLLLDVRGELHRVAARPIDRLRAEEQPDVATRLGYADADALLTAVAEAARTVAHGTDQAWRRVRRATDPPRRWAGRRAPQRRPLGGGAVEQDGEVVLADGADPRADPALVLRVAAAAAQAGLPLSAHAAARLAAEGAELPRPWPADATDALVTLLGAGPALLPVFETLVQAGVVTRLLPEWSRVRSKPQRNPVHRYTVDRHLLGAAVEAGVLTRRVQRPDLLLLGAFLHDIGKGWPGDHTVAGVEQVGRIATRLGLADADRGTLGTLVRHHLLLPELATRRDPDDPATVEQVARAVGDRDTLALLAALTEADALATGPAAWSEWRARLVADLVARTARLLTGERAGAEPAPRDELPATARRLLAAGGVGVDVAAGDAATWSVTLAGPDRPGALARAAGVLALHRLDVRAARAFPADGRAVSVFTVAPRFGSPPEWAVVRAELRRAVTDGGPPLAERLREREEAYPARGAGSPPEVHWDDAATGATVVEVRAHDRVGLLHRLAQTLADAGLDVRGARVSTLGAEAVDAFYVVERDGAPVTDPLRRAAVARSLLAAAGPPAR